MTRKTKSSNSIEAQPGGDNSTSLIKEPATQTRSWLGRIKAQWQLQPLEKPRPDPELLRMGPLERSAETLRYSLPRAEFWLSPKGSLRQWLRFNLFCALILGSTSLLVVP